MAFVHEVESVFQGTHYKKEAQWGVAPSGNAKLFGSMSVTPTFVKSTEPLEVKGLVMPVGMAAGAESSTWSGEGMATIEELPLFIQNVISDLPSDPNSFTFEHCGLIANGCTVSGWTLEGDTTKITQKVDFVGKKAVPGTMSDVDALGSFNFFQAQNTTIKFGNSPLLKLFKWSVGASNFWAIADFINPAEQSVAQTKNESSFSVSLPLNTQALEFISTTALIPVEIKNITTIGTSVYTLTISFDVMFEAPDSPSDINNVWAIGLKGKIMNKATTKEGASITSAAVKVSLTTPA